MNFQLQDGDIVFGDLDEFFGALLRRLPDCAAAEDEATKRRLYGGVTGGKDPDADEEWKEMVAPELQDLFRSHIDIVTRDLENIEERDEELTLRVPSEHIHAWIHTLNQARLALGAKWDVTEDDMSGRGINDADPEKAFALLQIEIYGLILNFFIQQVDF
jgi:hypothetical protein